MRTSTVDCGRDSGATMSGTTSSAVHRLRGNKVHDQPTATAGIISEDADPVTDSPTRGLLGKAEWSEKKLVRRVDLRLCTIAGLLCSLNLLDSGILSSAAVTSMQQDLDLTGDRFSVAIFIFTLASICFQLPATILMRFVGPSLYFGCTTVLFGIITVCTAYVKTWQQMIVLRIMLGISMSGIFPGLSYLISTWYTRKEQQLRFAFLQSGEVSILATGSIVNYGLNHLDGRHGYRGWQWMYLVQGAITIVIGLVAFVWIPEFPENSGKTLYFLSETEIDQALTRIHHDRQDAGKPEPLTLRGILIHFLDPKLYQFSLLFYLLNVVSTALNYFLPTILVGGMGFTSNEAILLSAPPYYYAVIPALISSYVGDKYRLRGPVIIFNALCLIIGISMLGFSTNVIVRYTGTYLATGAYVSNWAAMNAYQANNITGQWKRATVAAAVTACNGLGGITGSYIFRQQEASQGYPTAIWVSLGSHLLIILIAIVSTFLFRNSNRKVDRGGHVIEGVSGFRYTY